MENSKEKIETTHIPAVWTEFSILKEDLISPTVEYEPNEIGFSGTENFRAVLNVFGLSQPTAEGIVNLMEYFQKPIIWMNLREEPVIYINSRPYVLRDKQAPFSNIRSFMGISYTRLEEMEMRLKLDIIEMAKKNRGFIQVHTEKQLKALWISTLYVQKVQTVRELFESIGGDKIKYYRTPVSRKLYNKENFLSVLDTILSRNKETDQDLLFGFNCGTGLGRTSYAMAACLIRKKALEYLHLTAELESPSLMEESGREMPGVSTSAFNSRSSLLEVVSGRSGESDFAKVIQVLKRVHGKDKLADWLSKVGNVVPALEKALKGEYTLVERLGSAFNGFYAKKIVDLVLSYLQRFSYLEVLLEHIIKAQCTPDPKKSLKRACILMERYVSLIIYGIYRTNQVPKSFISWIEENPAIYEYIKQIATEIPNLAIFSPADIFSANLNTLKDTRKWTTIIGARTILSADSIVGETTTQPIDNVYIACQITGHLLPAHIPENAKWINLRAEPVIYIGGVPHSERDRLSPHRNIKTIAGITQKLIETQESLLCKRIRNEGAKMNGQLILFDTTTDRELITKRVNVKGKKVTTCDDFMKIQLGIKNYQRIPMVSKSVLYPNTIDAIMSVVINRNSAPLVFQASGFGGRACTARTLAIVIETVQAQVKSATSSNLEFAPSRPIPIKAVEALIRILPNGALAENLVRFAYSKAGQKDIYAILGEPDSDPQPYLSNHFLMITMASFILLNLGPTLSFREWLNQRQDIMNLFNLLKTDRLKTPEIKHPLINRPWGCVLTPHTMLKNDFFPGLKSDKIKDSDNIPGCYNFRMVRCGENDASIAIGLAQPTGEGVGALADYLKREGRQLHWFCLRQEPVIYLKGRPFVLRTTDLIYENVITEGITREWVENIETRMKFDCLEECQKNGSVMVHDEVFENSKPKLVHEVMQILPEEVQTLQEVFTHPHVVYYRLPISDEQTPLPEIYDELYQTILSIKGPSALVFSCQMGRGRTTTGIVISRLIAFVQNLKEKTPTERDSLLQYKKAQIVYKDKYMIISKLLQVLPKGRESKNIVDEIISQCVHVQNIYDDIEHQKTSGYLIRYFYLICFGSFLLESFGTSLTFKEYLSERMEIDAIANDKEYLLSQ
ncbi:hypothetical protein NEHOM01_0218 [Nematocida homosporus]|uniref:uncharacterized protein n=1 Tax=Nematocida homosporus TaxID=1912981 RepID=UPI00221E7B20|nr:uncharacterized protein NEHOM01_0218 [Nematocida homosporus]KAI5184543.1 hypothetical protein NEHOM01_0218 [Nematocida homosporus]